MNFLQQKFKQDASVKHTVLSAGSELLSKYQEEWSDLHANSRNSSAKAKEFDHLLSRFASDVKQTEEKLTKFHLQLQTLPAVVKHVEDLSLSLEKLETLVIEVSCAIDFYEKVCDDHDSCNQRQKALREVNDLRMAKRQELEKVKEQLAREHADQLADLQAQQSSLAAERQKQLLNVIALNKE